jgi:hypothetical protein
MPSGEEELGELSLKQQLLATVEDTHHRLPLFRQYLICMWCLLFCGSVYVCVLWYSLACLLCSAPSPAYVGRCCVSVCRLCRLYVPMYVPLCVCVFVCLCVYLVQPNAMTKATLALEPLDLFLALQEYKEDPTRARAVAIKEMVCVCVFVCMCCVFVCVLYNVCFGVCVSSVGLRACILQP